jgi:hypothetical protein
MGGPVELPFRGRNSLRILEAVVGAEEPHVERAAVHLVQVHRVGPGVGGGEVLEQKDREEAAQQRIALDERLHGAALLGQLLLHAADENGRLPRGGAFVRAPTC